MSASSKRPHIPPSEPYSTAGPSTPREAATVILVRADRDADALEVLLVQRSQKSRVMAGVWVFPGGSVDPSDRASDRDSDRLKAHRNAAIRELQEEAGIALPPEAELILLSRWITPAVVQARFDTRFFLSVLPDGQGVHIDEVECVDFHWYTPASALAAYDAGEIALVFPTIKHLELLGSFATVDELIEYARGRTVTPIEPRVQLDGSTPTAVLLPGDPGY